MLLLALLLLITAVPAEAHDVAGIPLRRLSTPPWSPTTCRPGVTLKVLHNELPWAAIQE